jgi:nucleotide-binding universal stress UspA family protein
VAVVLAVSMAAASAAFMAVPAASKRVSWDKCTEEGRAATSIVQQAGESQADVIVIGTHGGSGLAHMLLGSVAEEVVHTAPCSILTVRPEAFQFELP